MSARPSLLAVLLVLGCTGSADVGEDEVDTGHTDAVDTVETDRDTDPGGSETDTLIVETGIRGGGDTDDTETDTAGGESDETGTGGTDDTDTLGGTDDTDTLRGTDDTDGSGGTDDTDGSGGTDDTDGSGGTDDDTLGGTDDTDAPWTHDTGWWWDTSEFKPGLTSCDPDDLDLGWVFGGSPGEDWIIASYPDADPSPALADYTGAVALFAKTRDGATTVDVDVPNLRWMDNDFPVLAMGEGYVVAVQDGQEDRTTTCSGDSNQVAIRHDNGFVTIYKHLKKNSLRVRRSDRVTAGQVIGIVGSSGCAPHPRVSVQMLDCDGDPVDPFALQMFTAPPAYTTPLAFMDMHVYDVPIDGLLQLADPAPDAEEVLANEMIGFGLMASGGQPGDQMLLEWWRPDGVLFESVPITLSASLQRHAWWWNRRLGDFRGTWTFRVRFNGVTVEERTFFVHAQVAALAVAEASLGDVLLQHRSMELEPAWLDAYTVNGAWFYNLLSEPGLAPRELWWGADLSLHEAKIAEAEGRGLQPVHVDASSDGTATRYLAIVAASDDPWEAYAGASGVDHWDDYVTLQDAKWRPKVLVATGNSFDPTWTALWDDRDVGTYLTLVDVPRPDFFGLHQVQRAAGRYLSTLDVRVVDREPFLVGVWDEQDRGNWSLKTLLEQTTFDETHETNRMGSLRLRAISGYERFGSHRFAAWWTEY